MLPVSEWSLNIQYISIFVSSQLWYLEMRRWEEGARRQVARPAPALRSVPSAGGWCFMGGWWLHIVVGTFSHLPAKEGFSECRTFCVWELAQYGLEPCLCDTHLLYITTIQSSPVKQETILKIRIKTNRKRTISFMVNSEVIMYLSGSVV